MLAIEYLAPQLSLTAIRFSGHHYQMLAIQLLVDSLEKLTTLQLVQIWSSESDPSCDCKS